MASIAGYMVSSHNWALVEMSTTILLFIQLVKCLFNAIFYAFSVRLCSHLMEAKTLEHIYHRPIWSLMDLFDYNSGF